ncbi:uncharacterized protein LOC143293831 isoform X2 [Babylonia areolata]|uniref:uncharacterized protein LOC143293831 isoform X2 n=1 Tax=Babylonia areolata TaxID=304850 RepID=UPI003FD56557
MVVNRRHKDLVSPVQSEGLQTGLSLMRKGVSSLRMAVQTHLKYSNNPQAAAAKLQVLDQTITNLCEMRTVLESGPPSDLEAEEAGHFVSHIDKVLEGLDEGHRCHLSADLESWVASIVRHAMGVAHLAQGTYRHLITRTCQRILQSKFRLFELQEAAVHSPHLSEIRLDYEGVCEVLLDEFCELEKHVNMALLNLIIDTSFFTSQPLEQLASRAIHQQVVGPDLGESDLGEEFISHGDKLCQVAAMASASSMDPKKVRAVRLATSRLDQLLPEVLPTVSAVARHHGNEAAVRHLKGLVQEWGKETETLVRALDSMTDPAAFLDVTEQRMRQGVNVVRGKVCEGNEEETRTGLRQLLAHARRMMQVATHVVDHHCDPLFRNGLMVFIQQLQEARWGVKEASQAVLEDLSHARLVDTLHRRLVLLLDAAADVRQGVKGDNHVDVLNPARQRVRQRHHESDSPSAGGRSAKTKNVVLYPKSTPKHTVVPSTASDVTTRNTELLNEVTNLPPPITFTTTTTTQHHATTPIVKALAAHDIPASLTSQGEGQKRARRKVEREASVKHGEVGQRKGETSLMVQSCGEGLVLSALGGEKGEVSRWIGDILGWTSHLGEVALSLFNHCHQASHKSELRLLTVEMDRVAPQVMEAARFVSAGDRGQTDSLQLLADDWINACRRLVIVVDVAVGDWLLLIESITQAASDQDTNCLKSQLSVLDRNQREMNQLLTRAKLLEGKHIARGSDIVHFFQEAQLELDNLTVTLKTTADSLATTGDNNTVNRTQLVQRGREWCVLMTCLVSELDFVANALSTAGQASLGIPAISTSPTSSVWAFTSLHSKLVPLLQEETGRLKDVLASLVAGGNVLVKKRSEDLSQCLSSILGEVVEIAQNPVDDVTLPQAQLFARLDAGLARSRWTEKAIEAEQFVQRHCHRYSVLITNLLVSTHQSGASLGGAEIVPTEVTQLQVKVKAVSQRALQAIQLTSDLQHRATVRHCLDNLTSLLSTISEAATDYVSGIEAEKSEREVQKASTQWGAKVHCLLSTLRSMSEVKPSVITELEKQLSGQPLGMSAPTPAAPPTTLAPPLSTCTPFVHCHTPVTEWQASLSHTQSAGSPREKETGRTALSVAPQRESPHAPSQSNHSGTLDEAETQVVTMSPYRRSALYTSWLASAQYLGDEVAGWEDSDNHFVHLVHTMAQHCHHMADFARGGTSLKDSEEVGRTGLSLAASGKELETFARSLLAMSTHHRNVEDLRKAADRISTCSNQLHIVASVLYNAPGHPQGDCILARNAANLVDAVRLMFSIAEGISVASPLMAREGNETDCQVVDLLTRWQHKLAAYRSQQALTPRVDELGLRRMERHNPPSLTNLLDQ